MTDLDKLIQLASADTISDELLAAYIDGNTTAEENAFIESSAPMEDLNDISELVADTQSFEEKLHFYDGDYGFWELGIPPVLDIKEDSNWLNDFSGRRMQEKTYGYESNFALDPFDETIFQGYLNTCAIRCQEIILRDYGIMIPQEDLMKFAENNGWYNPDPLAGGTAQEATGNLLVSCDIPILRKDDCNIYDIIGELRQGHRIIVGVDAHELWANKDGFWKRTLEKTIYKFQDKFVRESANHALVVAGVRVNPDNPSDIKVIITDPGTGDMCIEYPYSEFKEAWEDSQCFMVATQIPAPFQYNSETHMMEPSNFASEFDASHIRFANSIHNIFPTDVAEKLASVSSEYAKDNIIEDDDMENWLGGEHNDFDAYNAWSTKIQDENDNMEEDDEEEEKHGEYGNDHDYFE